MALIPWKTKHPAGRNGDPGAYGSLATLRDEINHVFDSFLREPFGELERFFSEGKAFLPAVDVAETEHEITLRAEVPGVKPEELQISVQNNVLIVAGEKKEEKSSSEGGVVRSERRFGSFRREVALPPEADAEQVTADFKDGVLTVHVAKSPAAQPKRIAVKAG